MAANGMRFEAFDAHATKKRELAAAEQELVSLKTRKSLLPPSSIENRAAIAAATGIPEDRMPFAGELIQDVVRGVGCGAGHARPFRGVGGDSMISALRHAMRFASRTRRRRRSRTISSSVMRSRDGRACSS